jgi:hypothetical protein
MASGAHFGVPVAYSGSRTATILGGFSGTAEGGAFREPFHLEAAGFRSYHISGQTIHSMINGGFASKHAILDGLRAV